MTRKRLWICAQLLFGVLSIICLWRGAREKAFGYVTAAIAAKALSRTYP